MEENQRMQAYLGSILEDLPCGVLVADANGISRVVNPEARRLLALDPNLVPDGISALPQALCSLRKYSPMLIPAKRKNGRSSPRMGLAK